MEHLPGICQVIKQSEKALAQPWRLSQYGHSQSEKKLGVGDKYHRSIKVHT